MFTNGLDELVIDSIFLFQLPQANSAKNHHKGDTQSDDNCQPNDPIH